MIGYTSGKTTRDPMPWLSEASEIRYRLEPDDGFGPYRYAPRPEFDNHNPILVAFRAEDDIAADWLDDYEAGEGTFYDTLHADFTPEQIAHAVRVITKLADLRQDPTANLTNGVTD